MRDSSAVVGGGDLQTNPEHNEHLGEAGLQMYLSKLLNVFVQIAKCICPNCEMYLSKSPAYPCRIPAINMVFV